MLALQFTSALSVQFKLPLSRNFVWSLDNKRRCECAFSTRSGTTSIVSANSVKRQAEIMAPVSVDHPMNWPSKRDGSNPHGRSGMSVSNVIPEGWSQGVLFGGLLVLVMFTIANMRRHVLLHRLILLEAGHRHLLHTLGN